MADKPIVLKFIQNVVTVDFGELDGSPEEMVASAWSGVGATRKFICLASNRIQLVNQLLGYSEPTGVNILVHFPAPFGPDIPSLIATSVVVKPFGKCNANDFDERYADYDVSVIDVNYEVANRIPSGRYGFITLTEEILDTTELLTVPSKELYWGTGGGREQIDSFDAPNKLSHGEEWVYTISGATVLPDYLFDYVGQINSVEITSPSTGRIYEPGTLLYAAPIIVSEVTFSGVIYRITLRFLYKNNGSFNDPKGWNWFPRYSETGADVEYERIYDDDDNAKIFYVEDNFRDVFV